MNSQGKPNLERKPIPSVADVESETQDEIEQIINEIEDLQHEMTSLSPPKAKPKNTAPLSAANDHEAGESASGGDEHNILKEFSEHTDEPWVEETLASLKAAPPSSGSENPSRAQASSHPTHTDFESDADLGDSELESDSMQDFASTTHDLGESLDSIGGSLAMTIRGNMTLQLNYENPGQQISIDFSSDAIRIRLSDGTEFKVPVRTRGKASKKAA